MNYVHNLIILLLIATGCGDDNAPQDASAFDQSIDTDMPQDATDAAVDASLTCDPPAAEPTSNFFTNISRPSGLWEGAFITESAMVVPINDHSRLGFVDLNGDGFDDIVAHSLFPNPDAGIPFDHLIQLNQRDGTYSNFSVESGLKDVQAGFFAFGDVDGDGDQDCFAGLDLALTGESDRLFLNDGQGHFTERENSGLENPSGTSTNALFADFNNDAKLDLFVGHGGTTYAAPDALFLGNGDGTFVDASTQLGGNVGRPTNGSVNCDYDNDGDQDIILSTYGVSFMNGHNVLFENDGSGNFTNVAQQRGFHALPEGNYYLPTANEAEPGVTPSQYVGSNGFGIDCKDVNNDGNYDIFLTTISHPNAGDYGRKWSDPTQLLINQGEAGGYGFKNEFVVQGLPFNEGDVDGSIQDFDNDGRLDLAVSRDNKYEGNYPDSALDQKAWFGLYRQSESFQSLGVQSGINKLEPLLSTTHQDCTNGESCPDGESCQRNRCRKLCTQHDECTADETCAAYFDSGETIRFCRNSVLTRGAQNHAWSDIDRDGDVDLLVGGRDKGGGRPNFLFRNDIGSTNSWIALTIVGDGSVVHRDAIGTRVELSFSNGTTISREVQSSRGMYNSMDTKTLHFGLGAFGCDFEATVRWPNGEIHPLDSSQFTVGSYQTLNYPNVLQKD